MPMPTPSQPGSDLDPQKKSSSSTPPHKELPVRSTKHIVIVGAGFAGLTAAKKLSISTLAEVTLLDRTNYHLFQPLLYQVAMAGLNPGDIAIPIRAILSHRRNVRVLMAEVQKVDLQNKQISTDFGPISYDYLILACGSQHSYFGHDDWEGCAPGLKTLEQATEIRRRVLLSFELAERETNPAREKELLTFVVIGGGPTGVELAGAIGEISRYTLSRDFRHIDPSRTRIILIEAGPRILPSFSEELAHQAMRDLENLGVTVWTNTRVTDIHPRQVTLGDEVLRASTILWAAGVKPSRLNQQLNVPLDRTGRVIVGSDLSIPQYPEVFALGDQAAFFDNGKLLPGLAPVAIQEGRAAAEAILADLHKKPRKPFKYRDKGQMATIGRRKAVAQIGRFQFSGILAWFAWLVVHVYYLVGFKNRIFVLVQWLWSYATYQRGSRLITNREWRSYGAIDAAIEKAAPSVSLREPPPPTPSH